MAPIPAFTSHQGFVGSRTARTLAETARSPWALSWPLGIGPAVFVCPLNIEGLPLLADPDSHWHIAIGKWILVNGTVPTVDGYSHTFFGRPWIAKEWLSQTLLAGAYELGGWSAVAALCAAAIGFAFALMMRLLLRDIRPLPAALFTIAAIVMCAPHFLARPHVLAFPVMLIWVAGLVRAVEERRIPDPILLLAMLLWANLHGGFTLGLVLCGAFALEALTTARDAEERSFLLVEWAKFTAAAVLVACITPYGPESILVTFRIFDLGDALNMISEWKSPDFQSQPLQEVILLVGLYACLSRGLKLPLVRLLIIIGLVHLYLRYARNAELLAILAPLVIAPVLARQWPALRPNYEALTGSTLMQRMAEMGRLAGARAIALCLLLMLVFAAGMTRFATIRPPEATTPAAAFDYIREANLHGPVFNHYGFGGFLIHAGIPTFIDGRGELYGGEFIKHYVEAISLRGDTSLEQMLDQYKIEWTFLLKDQAANRLLARLPGWKHAYTDDTATIYVRRR